MCLYVYVRCVSINMNVCVYIYTNRRAIPADTTQLIPIASDHTDPPSPTTDPQQQTLQVSPPAIEQLLAKRNPPSTGAQQPPPHIHTSLSFLLHKQPPIFTHIHPTFTQYTPPPFPSSLINQPSIHQQCTHILIPTNTNNRRHHHHHNSGCPRRPRGAAHRPFRGRVADGLPRQEIEGRGRGRGRGQQGG